MAWGKKPWQGTTKLTPSQRLQAQRRWGDEFMSISSQYQSRRETQNTLKGFVMLIGFMGATIAIIYYVGKFFA